MSKSVEGVKRLDIWEGKSGLVGMKETVDGKYICYTDYQTLEAENKRLREALTKYSDRNNWKDGTISGFNCYENIFVLDGYKGWFLARQALGGEV